MQPYTPDFADVRNLTKPECEIKIGAQRYVAQIRVGPGLGC